MIDAKDIHPDNFRITPISFILRQIHTTIFENGSKGIDSTILSAWSANDDFSQYTLCPKKDIRFTNGQPFTAEALMANIKHFDDRGFFFVKLSSTTVEGDCAKVAFRSPFYGFIEEMTVGKYSVIYPPSLTSPMPIGIGAYRIKSFDKEKELVLEAVPFIEPKPDFDTIRLIVVGNKHLKMDQVKKFHEVNLLMGPFLPPKEEMEKVFAVYKFFELQNLYLFINHPSQNVREIVFNCTDRKKVAEAFGLPDFVLLNNDLPQKLLKTPEIKQDCSVARRLKAQQSIEIMFTLDASQTQNLQNAFNQNLVGLGVTPKLTAFDRSVAIKRLFAAKKSYGAYLGRLDGSIYKEMLKLMGLGVEAERAIDLEISNKEKQRLLEKLLNGKPKEKDEAIQAFFQKLNKSFHMLPIAELRSTFYYPKDISFVNKNSSVSFTEYDVKDVQTR